MPDHSEAHLSLELLLHYSDGELATEEKAAITQHLESCWQCRARYLDLQSTINRIIQARQRVLGHSAASVTWSGLSQKIQMLESTIPKPVPHWIVRCSRWVTHRARLAGFVATILVALLWFAASSSHSSLRAEQLLTRAVSVEKSPGSKPTGERRRMRLSVRKSGLPSTQQLEYEIWVDARGTRTLRIDAASTQAKRLVEDAKTAFNSGLAWHSPTSAQAFQAWRNRVEAIEERIEARPDSELALITVPRPAPNQIHQAELVVESSSGRAVQTAVRVGSLEITVRELSVEPFLPPAITPVILQTDAALRSEELLPPADLDSLEMALRHGLHHLGADLGEPIEVYRNKEGELCVEALDLAAERLSSIRELVRSLPPAKLITQPGHRHQDESANLPVTLENLSVNGDRQRDPTLIAHLGSEAAFQLFSRQATHRAEQLLNRAYALDRLARAYPPAREKILSATARTQLHEMLRVHRVSAQAELSQLRASLPASTVDLPNQDVIGSWQQVAHLLLISTKDLNRALNAALGFLAGPPAVLSDQKSFHSAHHQLLALERFTNEIYK